MSLRSIVEWDENLSARMRLRPGQPVWWRVAAFLAHSGDSWFWMAALGLLWLFYRPWRREAALIAVGVGGLALTVFAIKFLFKRRRPEGEWGAIYRNTDPHSFPSGHAARAALLAVMALGLGPAWFGLAVLLWSPLVSLARVWMGVHFLSDILAGTAVGVAAGLLMLRIAPLLIVLFPFAF